MKRDIIFFGFYLTICGYSGIGGANGEVSSATGSNALGSSGGIGGSAISSNGASAASSNGGSFIQNGPSQPYYFVRGGGRFGYNREPYCYNPRYIGYGAGRFSSSYGYPSLKPHGANSEYGYPYYYSGGVPSGGNGAAYYYPQRFGIYRYGKPIYFGHPAVYYGAGIGGGSYGIGLTGGPTTTSGQGAGGGSVSTAYTGTTSTSGQGNGGGSVSTAFTGTTTTSGQGNGGSGSVSTALIGSITGSEQGNGGGSVVETALEDTSTGGRGDSPSEYEKMVEAYEVSFIDSLNGDSQSSQDFSSQDNSAAAVASSIATVNAADFLLTK